MVLIPHGLSSDSSPYEEPTSNPHLSRAAAAVSVALECAGEASCIPVLRHSPARSSLRRRDSQAARLGAGRRSYDRMLQYAKSYDFSEFSSLPGNRHFLAKEMPGNQVCQEIGVSPEIGTDSEDYPGASHLDNRDFLGNTARLNLAWDVLHSS